MFRQNFPRSWNTMNISSIFEWAHPQRRPSSFLCHTELSYLRWVLLRHKCADRPKLVGCGTKNSLLLYCDKEIQVGNALAAPLLYNITLSTLFLLVLVSRERVGGKTGMVGLSVRPHFDLVMDRAWGEGLVPENTWRHQMGLPRFRQRHQKFARALVIVRDSYSSYTTSVSSKVLQPLLWGIVGQ